MNYSAPNKLTTDRLILQPLNINDAAFIFALVNTPGWLKFIGDRNVKNQKDAEGYINRILDNPNAFYWVVKLKDTQEAIGVITFLKRDYLEHFDLGFAFMPEHNKQGYAYEAANIALHSFFKTRKLKQIQGITDLDNANSVRLLQRLGFVFEKEMQVADKIVVVYNLVIL